MRILFVVNCPEFFLSHRLCLALAALRAGHEVHVATPVLDGMDMGRMEGHGFAYQPIALRRAKARPWHELATLRDLFLLYRRLKPDLVHHVTVKPILYGSLAARWAGVPSVLNAVSGLGYVFIGKSTRIRLIRRLVLLAYRLALRHPNRKMVFQNPDDVRLFLGRGLVGASDIAIIRGSGVDLQVFRSVPEPAGVPTVLFPARMLWDKGLKEFVTAAAILRRRGIPARFLLAGDIDNFNPASASRAWMEEVARSGTAEWLGKRSDMPALLASSHIVCMPSYREGMPKSLIEAAACGRPIVTSDVPGCREVVSPEVNGLLVPPRDAESLANALERLLLDPGLRERFGRRGRELAEAEFSQDRVADRTLEIYRELHADAGRTLPRPRRKSLLQAEGAGA